jgi:hypothetical protein|tara:strand:- start:3363 stop:3863 length:501 start_codon:yes stop_codon:yes gene_type:complete
MTFPALVPSVRTFTSGDVPQSSQVSLSGVSTGFRRGNRRTQQTLTLGFTNLTETQLNLIKDHYIDRQGTFDIFFLSAEVWNGYTTPPVSLLDSFAWRYAGPPTISDGIVGRWSVDVELQTHAIDITDLVIDGRSASAAESRTYNIDGGSASATPARTQVITAGLAA